MRQIFRSLPWVHPEEPPELQMIYRRYGTRRICGRNEVLKSGGENPKLFFLEKGLGAYLIASEVKGRPSVLSIITPGRTMGDITCMSGDVVNVLSKTWQRSVVWEVPPDAVWHEAGKDPGLLQLWARHVVHKQESHLEGMVANFTLTPQMRIRVLFKVLTTSYGIKPSAEGKSVVPLLLSNDQIGLIVNLTRVSVSRILSSWQEEGLIEKHRRTLIVRTELFRDIYDWIPDSGTRA